MSFQVPEFSESSQPKPDFESYLNKVSCQIKWSRPTSTHAMLRVLHPFLHMKGNGCLAASTPHLGQLAQLVEHSRL